MGQGVMMAATAMGESHANGAASTQQPQHNENGGHSSSSNNDGGKVAATAAAIATSATPSSPVNPVVGTTAHDRFPIILTHEGVSSAWKQRAARGPASRDVEHRNRIAEHVERTLGTKIELFISERQPCHGLTIDVLVVPPTEERPFYVLVTRGLSEMYMNVHPLAKHSPRYLWCTQQVLCTQT